MRVANILIVILAAVLACLSVPASAGPQFEVSYRSSTLWTAASDVAVSGHYAYYTMCYGLEVYDLSDPSGRLLVARFRTPAAPGAIAISGIYAYLTSADGLYVIDISDPLSPQISGRGDVPGKLTNITIAGNYAYICRTEYGPEGVNCVYVVNIGNPSAPYLVSTIPISGGGPHSVYIYNNKAYIAVVGSGLFIFDVINPAAPVQIGFFAGIGSYNGTDYKDVVVSGNYAFVVDYAYSVTADSGGFQVIDVSNPASPTFVTLYDIHLLNYIIKSGTTVYISTQTTGIYSFDVSNPTAPVLLGHNDDVEYVRSMALYGGGLLTVSTSRGFYDVSDPAAMTLVSSDSLGNSIWDVDVAGDYAYLAHTYSGLDIVDISNPDAPRLVKNIPTPGRAHKVQVVDHYAYLSVTGGDGLFVYDIADPLNPILVGQYLSDDIGQAEEFFIDGDRMYLNFWDYTIHIVDISDPTDPTLLGIYRTDTTADVEMAVASGNYAYVCASREGIHVVDVSDPAQPTWVATYTGMRYPRTVGIAGNYLLVSSSTQSDGTHIVDISDPLNPRLVSEVEAPTYYEVSVFGNYVFFPKSGFGVVDISNPGQPLFLGTYDTPGDVWDVCATNDRLYVADYNAFLIMDMTLPSIKLGDVNHDNIINVADAVFLINYVFKAGQAPDPVDCGDANCDGSTNVGDIVYIISFVFAGGPAPICQ
jgi:hypothetical protein